MLHVRPTYLAMLLSNVTGVYTGDPAGEAAAVVPGVVVDSLGPMAAFTRK